MATNQKDEKFIQYWENCMQLGRLSYSLLNGIIGGVILFLLTNLAYYLFTDKTFFHLNWDSFVPGGICYLVGVFLFYVPVWNVNSFKYHVILKKKPKKSKRK